MNKKVLLSFDIITYNAPLSKKGEGVSDEGSQDICESIKIAVKKITPFEKI